MDVEAGTIQDHVSERESFYSPEIIVLAANEAMTVSTDRDHLLRVWNLEAGDCLYAFAGHSDMIKAADIALDSRIAVSGANDKTIRVWDLTTGKCKYIMEGHTSYIETLQIAADGRIAVSGSPDKTLRVWDIGSGICLNTLKGHESYVNSISTSPTVGWLFLQPSGKGTCSVSMGVRAHINIVRITNPAFGTFTPVLA